RFSPHGVGGLPDRCRLAKPTLRFPLFSIVSSGRARLQPCRIARQTRSASAAGVLKPCLTRNACSGSIGAALAAPPIVPQANHAAPEKTTEPTSPTNPAHR